MSALRTRRARAFVSSCTRLVSLVLATVMFGHYAVPAAALALADAEPLTVSRGAAERPVVNQVGGPFSAAITESETTSATDSAKAAEAPKPADSALTNAPIGQPASSDTLASQRGRADRAEEQNASDSDESARRLTAAAFVEDGFEYEVLPDDTALITSAETSVTQIPETLGGMAVSAIGFEAFKGCTSLTDVVLPSTLTLLGDRAFVDCASITSVTVQSDIEVGDYWYWYWSQQGPFYGCGGLQEVMIAEGVTRIGNAMFAGTGVSSIGWPSTLTSLGEGAFAECDSLSEVVLPPSIMRLGHGAFAECSSLTTATVQSDIEVVQDNWYWYWGGPFSGCAALETVVVAEGVMSIGDMAFAYSGVRSVYLPSTLINMGQSAFEGCTRLPAIDLPDTLTSMGDLAFYGCSSLSQFPALPSSLATVPAQAFGFCSALTTVDIPSTVAEIGQYAFYACTSITSVTLPTGLASIPPYAFAECDALPRITLPTGLTSIGTAAFYGCDGLVEFPELPPGLAEVSACAFAYCSSLSQVTLPDTVTDIGEAAFQGCESLADLSLPAHLGALPSQAFAYCSSLTQVVLPSTLTELGPGVFIGCSSLAAVPDLPAAITEIPPAAFAYCSSLLEVVLPATVSTLGDGAFAHCGGITAVEINSDIVVPDQSAGWSWYYGGPFRGCSQLSSATFAEDVASVGKAMLAGSGVKTVVWPSTITTIGPEAFADCTSLTAIDLPDQLTSWGDSVFSGCTSLARIPDLPPAIDSIPAWGFAYCYTLTDIAIPAQVTAMGEGAFYACSSATSAEIPLGIDEIPAYAFAYCQQLPQVTLPSTIVSLGYSAFTGCSSLGELPELPPAVSHIPDYAFADCDSLTQVTLPETVAKLGWGAFADCDALASATIQSDIMVEDDYYYYWYWGAGPFSDCDALSHVTISEGVTSIGSAMFAESGVSSITWPSTLTAIGPYAFAYCSSLAAVALPSNIETLGEQAFYNCTSLARVDMMSTRIAAIEPWTFTYCVALSEIVLPPMLESIGTGAFQDCSALQKTYAPDSLQYIDGDPFLSPARDESGGALEFFANIEAYATQWAIDNGVLLRLLNGTIADDSTKVLDRSATHYIASAGSVASSGYVAYELKYAVKESLASGFGDGVISVRLPRGASLLAHTVTVDGVVTDGYTNSDMLSIPVSSTSGTIRFTVTPESYDVLSTYARLSYRLDGGELRSELLGVIAAGQLPLTLLNDSITSNANFEVAGVAAPEQAVDIYVDGIKRTTVTTRKTGSYRTSITLDTPVDYRRYALEARTQNQAGEQASAKSSVTYRAGMPKLREFRMKHGGQTYVLSEQEGLRPAIVFRPQVPFEFTVFYDDRETIGSVNVVSERDGVKRRIALAWDEPAGAYVGGGFFEPENQWYVPGELTVEYIPKLPAHDVYQEVDFTSPQYQSKVPDSWLNATVDVETQTESQFEATFTLDDEDKTPISVRSTKSATPSYVTPESLLAQGYIRVPAAETSEIRAALAAMGVVIASDDSGDLYVFVENGADSAQMTWVDIGGETVDVILENNGVKNPQVGGFFSVVGAVPDVIEISGNQYAIDNYRNTVWSDPTLTYEQRQESLSYIDNAQAANAAKTALTCVGVALALTTPFSWPVAIGMFAANWLVGYWLDSAMDDMHKYAIPSGRGRIRMGWMIDPSGYVYDANTEKRLKGVKVTVFYRGDDGEPVEWDALAHDQQNPLFTDDDGLYAWDVPEGWWRVQAEKNGYEAEVTEWLPVPPPQTEVHIGLTPKTYALSYELNGGSLGTAGPESYTTGVATDLPVPVREGHTFGGWFTDPLFSGDPLYRISEDDFGDKTLCAKWVKDAAPPLVNCSPQSSYMDVATILVAATSTGGGVGAVSYRLDGTATMTVPGSVATVKTSQLGAHTLKVWAEDELGYESAPKNVSFTVVDKTVLSLRTSSSKPKYKQAVTLTARLTRDGQGTAVPDKPVVFERYSGTAWVTVGGANTDSAGVARLSTIPYRQSKTVYRVRFAGASPFLTSASASNVVKPKVSVTKPVAPTTMYAGRRSTIKGYLRPRHKSGSYPVRIYRWKKTASGKWKSYGYVKARARDYSSYTKYAKSMSLPSRGKWRIRAYAPADSKHSATWSTRYDYVTVK